MSLTGKIGPTSGKCYLEAIRKNSEELAGSSTTTTNKCYKNPPTIRFSKAQVQPSGL